MHCQVMVYCGNNGMLCGMVRRADGKRIQELRWDMGLSQRELARRAGVSHTTVHLLERGGNVQPATLKAIADVLGVRPTELLQEGSV